MITFAPRPLRARIRRVGIRMHMRSRVWCGRLEPRASDRTLDGGVPALPWRPLVMTHRRPLRLQPAITTTIVAPSSGGSSASSPSLTHQTNVHLFASFSHHIEQTVTRVQRVVSRVSRRTVSRTHNDQRTFPSMTVIQRAALRASDGRRSNIGGPEMTWNDTSRQRAVATAEAAENGRRQRGAASAEGDASMADATPFAAATRHALRRGFGSARAIASPPESAMPTGGRRAASASPAPITRRLLNRAAPTGADADADAAAASEQSAAQVAFAARRTAPPMVWRKPIVDTSSADAPCESPMRGVEAGRSSTRPQPATNAAAASAFHVSSSSAAPVGFKLDGPAIDRLADDVMQRIDKRMRIERERRGM